MLLLSVKIMRAFRASSHLRISYDQKFLKTGRSTDKKFSTCAFQLPSIVRCVARKLTRREATVAYNRFKRCDPNRIRSSRKHNAYETLEEQARVQSEVDYSRGLFARGARCNGIFARGSKRVLRQ